MIDGFVYLAPFLLLPLVMLLVFLGCEARLEGAVPRCWVWARLDGNVELVSEALFWYATLGLEYYPMAQVQRADDGSFEIELDLGEAGQAWEVFCFAASVAGSPLGERSSGPFVLQQSPVVVEFTVDGDAEEDLALRFVQVTQGG